MLLYVDSRVRVGVELARNGKAPINRLLHGSLRQRVIYYLQTNPLRTTIVSANPANRNWHSRRYQHKIGIVRPSLTTARMGATANELSRV